MMPCTLHKTAIQPYPRRKGWVCFPCGLVYFASSFKCSSSFPGYLSWWLEHWAGSTILCLPGRIQLSLVVLFYLWKNFINSHSNYHWQILSVVFTYWLSQWVRHALIYWIVFVFIVNESWLSCELSGRGSCGRSRTGLKWNFSSTIIHIDGAVFCRFLLASVSYGCFHAARVVQWKLRSARIGSN